MASKTRLKVATDEELIDKCKQETKCDGCSLPEWISPPENRWMDPPDDTLVVVVDARSIQGAVQIVDKREKEYVDWVGTEEVGNLVMIHWSTDWLYYCLGSVRLAYIKRS